MLEAKGLACGYNSSLVLKNIDLSVEKGELLGIIGPNGSGKTTLIRALSRVIRPVAGKVLLQGKDIWNMSPKEFARKVAVVSQSDDFQSQMTVEEFVLLGRRPHFRKFQLFESKKDLEVAKWAMHITGVYSLRKRKLKSTSGGERQLASIARALSQDPEILLLDEPAAHLDIHNQISLLKLIKRLNQETGITVLIVFHELNLASSFCEKLILLENGKVYASGKPEDVITPENIKNVYKLEVLVKSHPMTSRPYVILPPV